MHNWRFLLLAFVAVFQPIASFTERSDVDGRQQRCDYRAASLLRDTGVHFHGTYRFTKPALADGRLSQREDVREIRRNEVREDSIRTPPQRRLADTLEKGDRTPSWFGRFSRAEYRLTRGAAILSRETAGSQHKSDHRDERSEIGRERRIYQTRPTALDSRLSKSFDDERTILSRRSSTSRLSMESRRGSQRNRDNTAEHGVRKIRQKLGVTDDVTRCLNARRIAKERNPRMQRSESQLKLEQIADRKMGRSKHTEFRSSLTTSARVNRAYENKESRLANGEVTHSVDREELCTQSRRILDNKNLNRNIPRSWDSTLQNRVSGDRRIIRDTSVRYANIWDPQSDQLFENRLGFGNRDTKFGGDRVVETQREHRNTERDTRFVRAIRSQEYRVSQRESRNTERERSVEIRRGVKDTRDIERNFRSVDRIIDNRREIHSLDRENTIANDLRAIQSDRERTTETRHFNRQSSSLKSERSAERRENEQGSERVTRFFSERHAQNQRTSRNVQGGSQTLVLQRDGNNPRATREERRQSSLGRDRITEFRNIRMNFENKRLTGNRRDTRSDESRRITVDSRGDTRNNERRSRSFDHSVDTRRDTKEYRRDTRTLRRSIETDSQAQRDSREFTREIALANRRSIQSGDRQLQTMGEKRNVETRGANHDAKRNSRSFRRERSAESRRDIRNVAEASRTFLLERSSEERRERSAEHRREVRKIEKDFRAIRGEEAREPRKKNVVWGRDSPSMDRNSFRATERLNMRDIPVAASAISRSVQRVSEWNSLETERREASHRFNTELTRKEESHRVTGNLAENKPTTMNWQYLFYILQGFYLCGILTHLINEKREDMKTSTQSWWPAPRHLIKVD